MQADLQLQAVSNTTALITHSTDPIQLHVNSLEATVEQGERIRKTTSMTVKGVCPATTSAHRHITALVHHLLQHATNQQFSITSVIVFGNPADGLNPIQVVFSSTDDKHAAYTASRALRSEKIYLDDDFIPLQLQP